jgi:pimeloyl-ACP methyl ester carboxylesterase
MAEIVLVGGSFLGAWAWERVTPVLRDAGHDVDPLTLTGFGDRAHLGSPETTLSTHADDIRAAIEVAGLHDVVLVLHSYSGLPGSIAACRVVERIARIVYVAAALPVPGKSLFDLMPPEAEQIMVAQAAAGDGWRIPVMDDETLDTYWGEHDLGPAERAFFHARGVGQPLGTVREPAPADLSAVEALPRTYIVCEGDPGDPPVTPGTPGWDVRSIATGHWPMISRPKELAALLDEIARS